MAYPDYKNGTSIYSSEPEYFTCHICPTKSQQSLEDHLKDENHSLMFAYFSRYFDDNGRYNICKTCGMWLSLDVAMTHANAHELNTMSNDEFELLFKNSISFRTGVFYCQLCNIKFFYWISVIAHIEVANHKHKLSSTINDAAIKDLSFSTANYKYAVKHLIFINSNTTIYCFLCECEIEASICDIVNHAMKSEHVNKEREFDDYIDSLESADLCVLEYTESENYSEDGFDIIISICTICNVEVNIHDIQSHLAIHNSKHLSKKINNCSVNEDSSGDINENVKIIEKSLRDLTVNDDDKGIASKLSNDGMVNGNSSISHNCYGVDKVLSCDSCKFHNGGSYQCTTQHVNNKKQEKRYQTLYEGIVRIERTIYLCTFCKCILKDSTEAEQHSETVGHKRNTGEVSDRMHSSAESVNKVKVDANNNGKIILMDAEPYSNEKSSSIDNASESDEVTSKSPSLCEMNQASPNQTSLNNKTEENKSVILTPTKEDEISIADIIRIWHGIEKIAGSKHLICKTCDYTIPPGGMKEHINELVHKNNHWSTCTHERKVTTIDSQPVTSAHVGPAAPSLSPLISGESVTKPEAEKDQTQGEETRDKEIINNCNASVSPIKTVSKTATRIKRKRGIKFTPLKMTDEQQLSCSFCDVKKDFVYDFHAHLTSHFWLRFGANPAIEENVEEDILKLLKPVTEECEDLEFIMKPEAFTKKTRFLDWRNRPLDIATEDGINIYQINKQKKEDLQLGILLTVPVDQENLYCLICREVVNNSIQTFFDHLCSIGHLDYLQQMIEDQRKFQHYPGELSDLCLGYEYMEEMTDDSVKCHACETLLPNDTSSLNAHVKDMSHLQRWTVLAQNAKTWFNKLFPRLHCDFYSVVNYWCVPCRSTFLLEIEFQKHLQSRKHIKQIQKFNDINEELIFDYCAVCATLWFGFLRTFGYHSKCPMHKHHVNQSFYLITKLPISAERLLKCPEVQVNKLMEKIDNLRVENTEKEKKLIRDLESISREKYPYCIAYSFGSRVSGLNGSNSDLDVFLDCSTTLHPVYGGKNSSAKRVKERLMAIKSCLEKNDNVWLIDREILDARTQILKTLHIPTKIECDISFTSGLTVEGTKLVRTYCEKFAHCRRMIIFIKNWMGHCELTGLNGIHNYVITWMAIFFLQQKRILPSVGELIAKRNQSRVIEGWETGVDLDFLVFNLGEPIERLLAGFFTFYAEFDYRNEVICPLLGRSVKKTDFQKRIRLPAEMKPYLQYLNCHKDPEPFRIDSVFCLQDPFDLSHNVAKAANKLVIHKLKSFCLLSAQILESH